MGKNDFRLTYGTILHLQTGKEKKTPKPRDSSRCQELYPNQAVSD
jgi:hypothetical protein